MLSRRRFSSFGLALGALSWASGARAELEPEPEAPGELIHRALEVEARGSWRGHGRRSAPVLLLRPAARPRREPQAALVLLHGRGEAHDDALAIHAWRSRYGLPEAHARLRRAPVRLLPEQAQYMRAAQLEALNRSLSANPFQGLVCICPVTPNPSSSASPGALLDEYADWLADAVLPAARAAAGLASDARIGIDGCSMGGYVAAEVFARKPHLFTTFGVVQPAIGDFRVTRYARLLAEAAVRPTFAGIHLLTSTRDPYRAATERLGRELERLGARPMLEVLPGPHDQQWLRAAGTLSMLAWHDRRLGEPPARRVL